MRMPGGMIDVTCAWRSPYVWLLVHWRRLRMIDASVMIAYTLTMFACLLPLTTSRAIGFTTGNTCAPTTFIAEKAVDLHAADRRGRKLVVQTYASSRTKDY